MKLNTVRIKNFRTITSEQSIHIENGVTLVGANNSGKTNALLAIYYFFTNYENKHGYNFEKDLPFETKRERTSITCLFLANGTRQDIEIMEKYRKLKLLLNEDNESANDEKNSFSINLYFNKNVPVYQVFPGAKKPPGKSAQYSIAQKAFVMSVLESMLCCYIPSNKSISQLYAEFVTPFMKKKVAEALAPHELEIKKSVRALSSSMNSTLRASGLGNITAQFEYPDKTLENLISGFELYVKDSTASSIFSKGMGVQSAVLLSSFAWITSQQSNKSIIWLIEEPETYMHPTLAAQSSKILKALASISTVVTTTHSLSFIPTNINLVQGVGVRSGGGTEIKRYKKLNEATEDIRHSLGVKFSDYFGLSELNLFVEGETDVLYINDVLKWINMYDEDAYPLLTSDSTIFKDFGGVSDLQGFVRSNYGLIRKEVAAVSLFDGDEAGQKSINALAGYFGKKGGYNSNRDYVLIPHGMAIESLYPDDWIQKAYEENANWFSKWVLDAAGNISNFDIKDDHKKSFMRLMFSYSDTTKDWDFLDKWIIVLDALENALKLQTASLKEAI